LITQPSTPIYSIHYETITAELSMRLEILCETIQPLRVKKYGAEVAAEWPIGHTPLEVVEKRAKWLQELEARYMESSCSSSDEEEGVVGTTNAGQQIKQERNENALLTPSPSVGTDQSISGKRRYEGADLGDCRKDGPDGCESERNDCHAVRPVGEYSENAGKNSRRKYFHREAS
jgi:hypothetical protein